MAITVVLALTAALILSLTLVPAAVALFVTGKVEEKENWLMRGLGKAYRPMLDRALDWPKVALAGANLLIAVSGAAPPPTGSEFLPRPHHGENPTPATRHSRTGHPPHIEDGRSAGWGKSGQLGE